MWSPVAEPEPTAGESAVPELFDGRVAWIFGDDFDVDMIVGVQNIKSYDRDFLLSVCMSEYEDGFPDRVHDGDLLVGGRNFGYGHPHYPPLVAMRHCGIQAIVAESYAPGFWRGETFNGLPLITCPGITDAVSRWDRLEIDWAAGRLHVPDRGVELASDPPSDRVAQIWCAGGSVNLLLAEQRAAESAASTSV